MQNVPHPLQKHSSTHNSAETTIRLHNENNILSGIASNKNFNKMHSSNSNSNNLT